MLVHNSACYWNNTSSSTCTHACASSSYKYRLFNKIYLSSFTWFVVQPFKCSPANAYECEIMSSKSVQLFPKYDTKLQGWFIITKLNNETVSARFHHLLQRRTKFIRNSFHSSFYRKLHTYYRRGRSLHGLLAYERKPNFHKQYQINTIVWSGSTVPDVWTWPRTVRGMPLERIWWRCFGFWRKIWKCRCKRIASVAKLFVFKVISKHRQSVERLVW